MIRKLFLRQFVTITVFLFSSCTLAVNTHSNTYSKVYAFGDSFSDTGNVYMASGFQLPPASSYYEGRYSDGPIWGEYLVSSLGLPEEEFISFAWGGALTGGTALNPYDLPGVKGMSAQLDDYLDSTAVDPEALYVIWAGTNDFIVAFIPPQADSISVAEEAINNIKQAVEKLRTRGATHIAVINIPNLGKIPGTQSGGTDISSWFSDASKYFNRQLSKKFEDDSVYYVDVFNLFENLMNKPNVYPKMIFNVTDYCYERYFLIPPSEPPSSSSPCYDGRNPYLFWDGIHMTTVAHELISDLIFDTIRFQKK